MGRYETQEAIRLMRQNADLSDFIGSASDEAIGRAEHQLGVAFPPSYQTFVEGLGAGRFADQIFFGVSDDAALDVVRRTLEQRQHGNLPDTHVIVAPYGSEAFFGFDCADRRSNDECPVAEIPRDYGDIEEPNYFELDFGSFMLSRVRDLLGERDQFRHP